MCAVLWCILVHAVPHPVSLVESLARPLPPGHDGGASLVKAAWLCIRRRRLSIESQAGVIFFLLHERGGLNGTLELTPAPLAPPSCPLLSSPRDQICKQLGGTIDDSELVHGMVFEKGAKKSAGGPTRIENAKVCVWSGNVPGTFLVCVCMCVYVFVLGSPS